MNAEGNLGKLLSKRGVLVALAAVLALTLSVIEYRDYAKERDRENRFLVTWQSIKVGDDSAVILSRLSKEFEPNIKVIEKETGKITAVSYEFFDRVFRVNYPIFVIWVDERGRVVKKFAG